MDNLGATQEMVDTLVLKNSVFAGMAWMKVYEQPCVPKHLKLWRTLSQFPNGMESMGRDVIDRIVEKKYTELVEYLNAPTTRKLDLRMYFPALAAITDSQEIVDWLLGIVEQGFFEFDDQLQGYTRRPGVERILQSLPANPNPRVVEWALGEKKAKRKDAFFANPHPLAVEHNRKRVVEAIFSSFSASGGGGEGDESKRVLSWFNTHPISHHPNPDLVLGVLADLIDRKLSDAVEGQVMLSTLLISLSQTDTEIVF